jgi:large subunit ribosomal protein L32
MGAVPKHKISHMRQGKRRRVISLSKKQTVICGSCKQAKLPHRVCPHCGLYKALPAKGK